MNIGIFEPALCYKMDDYSLVSIFASYVDHTLPRRKNTYLNDSKRKAIHTLKCVEHV